MSSLVYKELLMQVVQVLVVVMYLVLLVKCGVQDLMILGDVVLCQGVVVFIVEKMVGWFGYVGCEVEQGIVKFVMVFYGLVDDQSLDMVIECVEQLENQCEQDMLDWVNVVKFELLDCVYVIIVMNSCGFDVFLVWLVMELEVVYVQFELYVGFYG